MHGKYSFTVCSGICLDSFSRMSVSVLFGSLYFKSICVYNALKGVALQCNVTMHCVTKQFTADTRHMAIWGSYNAIVANKMIVFSNKN